MILPDGSVERPQVGTGDPIDAFVNELTAAVSSVESGSTAPTLSGELAREALRLCHAEIESVKTGQTIVTRA